MHTFTEEEWIRMFNALQIPHMDPVTHLNCLPGDFINLEYTLPSGKTIRLLDDSKTYYGAELCKKGSQRCYGLAARDGYLLVCEYGDQGSDPEIVVYKRVSKGRE